MKFIQNEYPDLLQHIKMAQEFLINQDLQIPSANKFNGSIMKNLKIKMAITSEFPA